ncbi:FtsX-like permease family protein [Marinospirillum sp. MEB164]|uniref:FtsX-like permease family protein n=1 Tax=Marinospirillum alkalitolerans TaxID=3123374 RepID=A0ABW8PWJ8_9GAMM
MMQEAALAARLLWRGVRAGEYRVLILALLLAVSCSTLLAVLGERMQGALSFEASRLAGGDLVVSGRQPADPELISWLEASGLAYSESASMTSMAATEADLLLVSVQAVGDRYPLLGQVRLSDAEGERRVSHPPAVGEIWIEPAVAIRLGLELGQTLTLGDTDLQVTHWLLETPEQRGGFSQFSPSVMVHLASLEQSALLAALSRAQWRLGLRLDAAESEPLITELRQRLRDDQRLRLLEEDQPALARALDEGQRFLNMAGLVAILLAALAIALAMQRQVRRQAKEVALLRCMGRTRGQVARLLVFQFVWLGLLVGLLGGALGYLAHLGLVALLAPLLPLTLPEPSLWPLLLALVSSWLLLLGLALAPILSLAQVSPLAVLQARPWKISLASGLTYSLALLSVVLIGYALSGDLLLSAATLLGLLLVGLLVAACGWLLLKLFGMSLQSLSWSWRQTYRRLMGHPNETLLQLGTFTLAFTAILLVGRAGTQLVGDWQAQLPQEAPNHFAVDIQPYEKDDFVDFLDTRGLMHSRIYPLVRGRLTEINDQAALEAVPPSGREDNTLRRELNLTWTSALPEGNQLLEGQWWPDLATPLEGRAPISIEQGMAERLGLTLGDQLLFQVAGTPVLTQVVSVREVDWQSFQPNFYVIFPPDVLEVYGYTYLASFYLDAQQNLLIRDLARAFPGVALLDIRAILDQAEGVLRQLSQGIHYLLAFVLLAGLLVTWALMMASLDARQKEQALLKVLGLTRRRLLIRQLLEFAAIGLIAGLLAAGLGELLYALIADQLLNLHWRPAPSYWLLPPLVGALLLSACAYLALRPTFEMAPHRLMQRLSGSG